MGRSFPQLVGPERPLFRAPHSCEHALGRDLASVSLPVGQGVCSGQMAVTCWGLRSLLRVLASQADAVGGEGPSTGRVPPPCCVPGWSCGSFLPITPQGRYSSRCRTEEWDSERPEDLPKVTQAGSHRPGAWTCTPLSPASRLSLQSAPTL